MQKRCPWCGKVVKTRGWNRFKENYQKRTPISFLFTKCPACNHFLGQNYKSLRVAFTGLAMLASVILAYVHISLVFIALALLSLYMINIPLVKMNENETIVSEQEKLHKARIITCSARLRREFIYTLTADFDSYPAYTQISPIKIKKADKKSGDVFFYFLYEHCDNANIKSKNSFSIFDKNILIGTLTYINNDTV